MMKFIAVFLLMHINILAQKKEFCSLYLPTQKNEIMLDEIYLCQSKFYLKHKLGEVRDIVVKKYKKGVYEIVDLENIINQKYSRVNRFKGSIFFIIVGNDKIFIKEDREGKNIFYSFYKTKKKIPQNLLDEDFQ